MFDIITIGSATRDVFLISDKFVALSSTKIKNRLAQCVSLGSKIELEKLVLTTGGGATNAAATFASLGFNTAAVTKIGDDAPGKDVVAELNNLGVSTGLMRVVKKGKTGYSTLLTMKDGERTILVYRGVSSTFTAKDVNWKRCKSEWIYLTSLGGNLALAKRIIKHAKKNKSKVAWNPGSKEITKGLSSIKDLIADVDVLNINKEEAQLLTKKRALKPMFKSLHRKGKITIITDGTQGAYAHQDKLMVHAKTTGAKSISRTGAGDAFGSGFVSGLIKKNLPPSQGGTKGGLEVLKYALAIGTLNAEAVIQKHGAKKGLLKKWPSSLKTKKIKITKI